MRRRRFAAGVLACVALAGCASDPIAHVDGDQSVDLSMYEGFGAGDDLGKFLHDASRHADRNGRAHAMNRRWTGAGERAVVVTVDEPVAPGER